jgi:hypothetical protein|tara:strand:+ start:425 stop:1075 length:651 start_codon:yes stop_codon:yes gene_type:complete
MEQRTIFRIVAFTLALYFFITNIILGSYVLSAGSWGGGLKFLTNWNLLLNFIIASCALLNERNSKFVSYYLLLPGSMVLNVLVFLLYWVIKLFGGFGAAASGWTMVDVLKDYYMHFGTSALLFAEVLFYSKAFQDWKREYSVFTMIFMSYIIWMEFFVQINNDVPCGTVSCGFPYLFLNYLDYVGRIIFYIVVWILGNLSWVGCRKLVQGPNYNSD